MAELSDAEKQVFKDAALRRRDRGIRYKCIRLQADASQVEAFYELWESWIERWPKTKAVDILLRAMSTIEARMRDAEEHDRHGHK